MLYSYVARFIISCYLNLKSCDSSADIDESILRIDIAEYSQTKAIHLVVTLNNTCRVRTSLYMVAAYFYRVRYNREREKEKV